MYIHEQVLDCPVLCHSFQQRQVHAAAAAAEFSALPRIFSLHVLPLCPVNAVSCKWICCIMQIKLVHGVNKYMFLDVAE